jgi:hypothetical protein
MNNRSSAEWMQRLLWARSRVLEKGGRVDQLTVFPPTSQSTVESFEHEIGYRLPEDFVYMLRQETGGFWFAWSFGLASVPIHSDGNGGNVEVAFVGLEEFGSLSTLYRDFQGRLRRTYLYSPDYDNDREALITRRVLTRCFPLYMDYSSEGDSLVLRCDVEPAEVLFLDHEIGYQTHGGAVVGRGYREFLDNWSQLGFPRFNPRSRFINVATGCLDHSIEASLQWKAWLSNDEQVEKGRR